MFNSGLCVGWRLSSSHVSKKETIWGKVFSVCSKHNWEEVLEAVEVGSCAG